MDNHNITLIKRQLFDRIEDASMLTQAHRIWLLNIIEGVTTTLLIREYTRNCINEEKHVDVKDLQIDEIVEYLFHNFIEK